ncbi:MAG: alpha-ribazole phosphatase [Nitrospinae bacterium]|nr:alpha-ribazole phosphatase [Nitrospinota bacterium]
MKGNPSCRILLFRHGETANAKEVCFNGHYDVGLSEAGQKQFENWATILKKENFKAVYSSDLKRTRNSAQCIAKEHGLEPVAFPELRELSFGTWEGMSVSEVETTYPGEMKERMHSVATFQADGGETYPQLQARVIPRFEEIVARHSNDQIVLVCHGGVNRVILGHLLGIPIDKIFRIHQDYAALNVIQYYDKEPIVEYIGNAELFSSRKNEIKTAIQ